MISFNLSLSSIFAIHFCKTKHLLCLYVFCLFVILRVFLKKGWGGITNETLKGETKCEIAAKVKSENLETLFFFCDFLFQKHSKQRHKTLLETIKKGANKIKKK